MARPYAFQNSLSNVLFGSKPPTAQASEMTLLAANSLHLIAHIFRPSRNAIGTAVHFQTSQ
jgi:hypothetical protein